jgi:GNAT superfamily N-acetyltransferase
MGAGGHTIAELSEGDIAVAAAQTHAAWGRGAPLAEHQRRAIEKAALAGDRMRYLGLFEAGELACALKRYRLDLATPDGPVATVGIGAVFTAEAQRRRGLAARLIEAALEGAPAALLFSDIAPAYYERMGFVVQSHVSWTARAAALPRTRPPERSEDVARMCSIYEASWQPGFTRARRSEASWRVYARINGAERAYLVGDDGYVVTGPLSSDGTLWIYDAAALSPSPEALWGAMRALAEAAGATQVTAWLRPDQAGGPFVASRRTTCIPMLRGLGGDVRSHFAVLDHF